jgi:bleomycin hydrolase
MPAEEQRYLLDNPEGDGGHWDTAVALIEKYGLVPQEVYPESVDSSRSSDLNFYLNKLLRQDAEALLQAVKEGKETATLKGSFMTEVFNLLAAMLGLPPRHFDYALRDKEGENFTKFSGTPLEFYEKFVAVDLEDYASLVSLDLADHPFEKSITAQYRGNVVAGHPFKHLNVELQRLLDLAVSELKAGEPLLFGCDVAQESLRKEGLLTEDALDFKTALDIEFTQSRSSALTFRNADISHAMVLVGVAFDEKGQATNWKVENSWGDENGQKGYFIASTDWMLAHTYQVVVKKDLLTASEKKAYEADPIVLAPWDAAW